MISNTLNQASKYVFSIPSLETILSKLVKMKFTSTWRTFLKNWLWRGGGGGGTNKICVSVGV